MTEYEVTKELDLRGLQCPMPMVKVSQTIGDVPVGGILKATATDPACESDIPAWARLTGHEVLEIQHQDNGEITLYVKRTG
jgi:tRNA 2-thiouridine synthesizing protein A